MKMQWIVIGFMASAAAGALVMHLIATSAEKTESQTPQVTLGEVTDLIDRLKVVAADPNGEWYRNGISLTFTGLDVTIKLKTKNGNEYNARARQLKDAVQMIADPAPDVRSALKGFNAEAKR